MNEFNMKITKKEKNKRKRNEENKGKGMWMQNEKSFVKPINYHLENQFREFEILCGIFCSSTLFFFSFFSFLVVVMLLSIDK